MSEPEQMNIFEILDEGDYTGLLDLKTGRTKGDAEDYEGFVDKFKPKLTTDDCYTPEIVYDAIADYVAARYGLSRANFVRPFWPGGDYESYPYKPGDVVVDNPPVSILTKIVRNYTARGVRFFLFAHSLTLFSGNTPGVCFIPIDAVITYENGAKVNTAFVTNLEPENVVIQVLPDLQDAITQADKLNTRAGKVVLPKYAYPPELITAAMCHRLSNYGVPLTVLRSEVHFTRALDDQRQTGKAIFGGGFLLSHKAATEKAAAEKAAAEKAAAEKVNVHTWELSARELQIIESLK